MRNVHACTCMCMHVHVYIHFLVKQTRNIVKNKCQREKACIKSLAFLATWAIVLSLQVYFLDSNILDGSKAFCNFRLFSENPVIHKYCLPKPKHSKKILKMGIEHNFAEYQQAHGKVIRFWLFQQTIFPWYIFSFPLQIDDQSKLSCSFGWNFLNTKLETYHGYHF